MNEKLRRAKIAHHDQELRLESNLLTALYDHAVFQQVNVETATRQEWLRLVDRLLDRLSGLTDCPNCVDRDQVVDPYQWPSGALVTEQYVYFYYYCLTCKATWDSKVCFQS